MGTGLWVVLRDDRFLLKLTDAELVALLRSLALAQPGQEVQVAVADAHLAFWSEGRLKKALKLLKDGLQGSGITLMVSHAQGSATAGRPRLRRRGQPIARLGANAMTAAPVTVCNCLSPTRLPVHV